MRRGEDGTGTIYMLEGVVVCPIGDTLRLADFHLAEYGLEEVAVGSFSRARGHFTSTFTCIQGWVQHSKRCSPFDRPVMWTWLQTRGRNVSGATEQGSLLVRRDLLTARPQKSLLAANSSGCRARPLPATSSPAA